MKMKELRSTPAGGVSVALCLRSATINTDSLVLAYKEIDQKSMIEISISRLQQAILHSGGSSIFQTGETPTRMGVINLINWPKLAKTALK